MMDPVLLVFEIGIVLRSSGTVLGRVYQQVSYNPHTVRGPINGIGEEYDFWQLLWRCTFVWIECFFQHEFRLPISLGFAPLVLQDDHFHVDSIYGRTIHLSLVWVGTNSTKACMLQYEILPFEIERSCTSKPDSVFAQDLTQLTKHGELL